jgi:hypothetical protein
MPLYGIIQEFDEFIDFKRNQKPLTKGERTWFLIQKQYIIH